MATIRSGSSTAKGRLEEELERSREDLEDFFENGTVALHWVAADGSILRVNQAELDLLGYKREEYVGRHIAEFHADPPVIQDILARLTRGEKLDKYEARLKAKDGSIKYVLISSNVRFREGRFINTRCFSLDVTELKKLEHALRESEQRLRATHDHAFAGIAEVALDGRFLRSNARFHQLTGYSVGELSHLTIKDVTHPEDSSEDADKFDALVVGKIDTYQAEKRFLTKNGAVIWVALSASLVRDEGGQPLYGIRVAQDISALKHAQTRQKLLLDELNHTHVSPDKRHLAICSEGGVPVMMRPQEKPCRSGLSRATSSSHRFRWPGIDLSHTALRDRACRHRTAPARPVGSHPRRPPDRGSSWLCAASGAWIRDPQAARGCSRAHRPLCGGRHGL